MRRLRFLDLGLVFGIFTFFAHPAAYAQGLPPFSSNAASGTQSEAIPAIAPDAEGLIKLDVVVTDRSGKPVSGLTSKDFTLLDQGQPSSIVSFHAFDNGTTQPSQAVEVILVLDTLGVNSKLVAHEQQEIQAFLNQNGGNLANPVAIFKVANEGLFSVAQPSTDGNALAAEFVRGKLRTIREFRGLQSEGLLRLQSLGAIATLERQKPGRKALIWIGPEWKLFDEPYGEILPRDQKPFDAVSWFYTLLHEARIAVYSIPKPSRENQHSANLPPDATADNAPTQSLLRRNSRDDAGSVRQSHLDNLDRDFLAIQSGGRVLEKSDNLQDQDLQDQINRCVAEGSTFYTLSFNPPRTDGQYEYRQLLLQPLKPDLIARTSGGYFNQAYYYDHSNPALRRVTVEQLEAALTAAQGRSDGDAAHQISALLLTERLNSARLASWKLRFHGAKATAALVSLADASAFLNLPASEIPADPPPSIAGQRKMMVLATEYLVKTVPKLPNLFATRTTRNYEEVEPPAVLPQFQETPTRDVSDKGGSMDNRPLHLANTQNVTVLYQDGNEIIDPGNRKHKPENPEKIRLATRGTFGPLAVTVISDAGIPPGKLTWSHWERNASGAQAVFRFAVPAEKRHYQVQYCCTSEGDGKQPFQRQSGYHGEIAIDPATGAILRLAIQADLNPALPLIRSDILVEYGPVEIGGSTYIFPQRSVTIYRGRNVKMLSEWDLGYRVYGSYATLLNDVTFSDYHLFRSQARMILDDGTTPEQK